MTVEPNAEVRSVFEKLLAHDGIKKALAYLEKNQSARITELKEMTVIQGAPFKEREERCPMFAQKLAAYGAKECVIDSHDNAYGFIRGQAGQPKVLVEAHLDTVFEKETVLALREEKGRIYCPGIGDDTAGLASVLSVLRAINHAGLKPVGTIMAGGTSGEEGEGDLRGIKGLLDDHPDMGAHIGLEPGPFGRITKGAVGSRRYEFIFRGPGGHSFSAFGLPSPLHAMGRAIAKMADVVVPDSPVTTYTVGTVCGGTSVNSIAFEGRMKLDMRSVCQESLDILEKTMLELVRQGVEEENSFRAKSGQKITLEAVNIGDRPAGEQGLDSMIVQSSWAATAAILGGEPTITAPSSTNTNAAIAKGTPSVILRTGGATGNTHNLEEWFEPGDSYKGDQLTLLLLFALVGLEGVTEPLAKVRL